MAKKFTELTADTTPTHDDIMAVSNDPAGTPASRKVTLANLWKVVQTWLFAADAGGTDDYAITLSPAISGYTNGQLYRFKANTANTGAATLAINGLAAKTIKKAAGGVTTDLASNDIRAGQMVDVVYDLSNDIFQMQSLLGNAPTGTIGGSTGGTDNAALRADGTGGSTVQSSNLTIPDDAASTEVGYLNIPQNSQSTNYTTVMADRGKHVYHPTSDDNPRTFTIDSNANVAYPIGTAITFVNDQNTLTIAITSDTLVWAEDGSTGSRTLAENGMATAIKVTSTRWIISGTGLS